MEVVEALLWSSPEELVPITDSTHHTCATRNQRLTLFLWLFVLPWQPFWVIYPCREVGDPRNKDLLLVPQVMALAYGMSHCAAYLYTWFAVSDASSVLLLRSLEDSLYRSNLHTETCTFLGQRGHLHWAFGSMDTMLTPNVFTYILVWLSVAAARPLRFAAGPLFLGPFGFFFFLWWFEGSFEAGSVWCWSVASFNFYVVLQPYLVPCGGVEKEASKEINKHE